MDCRPRPCDIFPNGRVRPLLAHKMAILVVDVQNYVMEKHPFSGQFHEHAQKVVIPNIRRLIETARQLKIEVVFTVMENQTKDGRDRSLDYKLSNFFIPKGSREAKVVDELTPLDDELVIPKTSCSLFNSTNFAYLMRNIGIDTIAVTGFLTDQCVDQTIRDGADATGGFWMIGVSDGCAAETAERHAAALNVLRGYCRMESTQSLIEAIHSEMGGESSKMGG
ncbi:hypothetical protein niasHS_014869 [Heterodera schachtii]|uniref:Isochorismatase-like domain-containing protein n=1 Tax=Heterodera schachtii TaxID=97005 RepID=A0ABD2IFW5_HETSC